MERSLRLCLNSCIISVEKKGCYKSKNAGDYILQCSSPLPRTTALLFLMVGTTKTAVRTQKITKKQDDG